MSTTNIVLVGNGAREHAICEALARSAGAQVHSVLSQPNPGISRLSKSTLSAKLDDAGAITSFAKQCGAEFAVFGPEAPLAAGVADALAEAGIPSFGPLRELAKLESSKSFTRALAVRHKAGGMPQFRVFESVEGMEDYVRELGPCVVKADGLAGGKGVKVWGDHLKSVGEAMAFAREILAGGSKVVVEEKLEGEEFSLQSIVDGKVALDCPVVQDHKRAFENDEGQNTGGMGSYSCENHSLPFLDEADLREAHSITERMLSAIGKETGKEFKGVMYGGFMATASGVKLLEYNVRFGDPEAMNVLPIMKTDFAQVCRAVAEGRLAEMSIEFARQATVCKYLVPQGYPGAPLKGQAIEVDEGAVAATGARLYYGSVQESGGKLFTTSSRSIGIVGVGNTLREAEAKASAAVAHVGGKLFYRRDIGTQELVQKRISHMARLRPNSC